MAGDRRYLFDGTDRAQLFDVGPTPSTLTAAGLPAGFRVRVQVLAGPNPRTGSWAALGVELTDERPYAVLIQPGTMRLHPSDTAVLPAEARVWLEDAAYRGTDRIMFNLSANGQAEGGGETTVTCGESPAGDTVTRMRTFDIEPGGTTTSLPPLDNEATDYVSLQLLGGEDCEPVLYGLGIEPVVELGCCDMLVVNRSEYAQLLFTADVEAGAVLLILEHTSET